MIVGFKEMLQLADQTQKSQYNLKGKKERKEG